MDMTTATTVLATQGLLSVMGVAVLVCIKSNVKVVKSTKRSTRPSSDEHDNGMRRIKAIHEAIRMIMRR